MCAFAEAVLLLQQPVSAQLGYVGTAAIVRHEAALQTRHELLAHLGSRRVVCFVRLVEREWRLDIPISATATGNTFVPLQGVTANTVL